MKVFWMPKLLIYGVYTNMMRTEIRSLRNAISSNNHKMARKLDAWRRKLICDMVRSRKLLTQEIADAAECAALDVLSGISAPTYGCLAAKAHPHIVEFGDKVSLHLCPKLFVLNQRKSLVWRSFYMTNLVQWGAKPVSPPNTSSLFLSLIAKTLAKKYRCALGALYIYIL